MRIAADFSLLGLGLYHAQARTGVHRVTDNWAKGLLKNPDIALAISAQGYLAETLAHFGKQNISLPTIHNKTDEQWARIEANLLLPFDTQSILSKTIRRLFYRFQNYQNIDIERLNDYQIYHSPYSPVPQVVQQHTHIKRVTTIHDLIPITHPQYFEHPEQSPIEQTLLAIGDNDYVICVSNATRDALLNHKKIDPNKVAVIPLAADSAVFYPCQNSHQISAIRKKYNIPTSSQYILSLATIEPRKNIPHIIHSFVQLIQQQPDIDLHLVLVGTKGWRVEEIMQEIKGLGPLQSRLIFTGYVPDEDLSALYSGALAFVYMSLVEGFGLPPLEAMQCGVPVIASNTSSLPEVISNAGLLLDPTNMNDLSQAILQIHQNQDLRSQLSQSSLNRSGLFSWQKFDQQHLDFYRKIV
jgi:glycosyltransferase involved in cell wall biosynthesis